MINRLFSHSKENSAFSFYSKRGSNPNELKEGYNNVYYRMCTSDKSFRVGFQEYIDGDVYLSFAVNSIKLVDKVKFAQSAISALSDRQIQNCKDRTGKIIDKSWELKMNRKSIEELFSLQEVLLYFFESQI